MDPVLGALALSIVILVFIYALALFIGSMKSDDWDDED